MELITEKLLWRYWQAYNLQGRLAVRIEQQNLPNNRTARHVYVHNYKNLTQKVSLWKSGETKTKSLTQLEIIQTPVVGFKVSFRLPLLIGNSALYKENLSMIGSTPEVLHSIMIKIAQARAVHRLESIA